MIRNRKSCIALQTITVMLGLLLCGLVLPCAAYYLNWERTIPAAEKLWCQADIQPPPEGKEINPDYISTRQELEQAWHQLQRVNKYNMQYYRWAQMGQSQRASYRRSWWKVASLDKLLAKTPMYVQKAPATAP